MVRLYDCGLNTYTSLSDLMSRLQIVQNKTDSGSPVCFLLMGNPFLALVAHWDL